MEQETKETTMESELTYSMMIVEISELDHTKLAQYSPTDVLIQIGKTIERQITKQDSIFSRYYTTHNKQVNNRMLMQMNDAFVVIYPQRSKKQLANTTKKITADLTAAGIRVKIGIAEYGLDGIDSEEVLATATHNVAQQ